MRQGLQRCGSRVSGFRSVCATSYSFAAGLGFEGSNHLVNEWLERCSRIQEYASLDTCIRRSLCCVVDASEMWWV